MELRARCIQMITRTVIAGCTKCDFSVRCRRMLRGPIKQWLEDYETAKAREKTLASMNNPVLRFLRLSKRSVSRWLPDMSIVLLMMA
jgi:hypothetical protein